MHFLATLSLLCLFHCFVWIKDMLLSKRSIPAMDGEHDDIATVSDQNVFTVFLFVIFLMYFQDLSADNFFIALTKETVGKVGVVQAVLTVFTILPQTQLFH